MWFILPLICFAVIVLIALGAVTAWAYHKAFYHSPRHRKETVELPHDATEHTTRDYMHTLIDTMGKLPYEPVEITAHDGVRLVGRYIHVRDGAPLQIQCHGYRGSAVRDFCGGNKLAREAGHNTLVITHRAHGESGSRTITFGIKERYDCLAWIEYAQARFGTDTPIFLSGVSMGAATVLMASSLPLPPQVKGIIADCPYTSPRAIIARVCDQSGYPTRLAMPFIKLAARLFGHFDLDETDAVTAVRSAKVPILLVHGEADDFVPCDMSREIQAACASECRLCTFPNAGHGLSFIEDEERYRQEVERFVEGCLK